MLVCYCQAKNLVHILSVLEASPSVCEGRVFKGDGQAAHSRTQEAKTEGSVQGQPWLHRKCEASLGCMSLCLHFNSLLLKNIFI